jgi:hypothetical protein
MRKNLAEKKLFTLHSLVQPNEPNSSRGIHCTENPIYVFPEMKLRGLLPNSYIHVSVSYLCIPRIARRYNVEIERQNIIILFGNDEAAQFSFLVIHKSKPDIILDSHLPFI